MLCSFYLLAIILLRDDSICNTFTVLVKSAKCGQNTQEKGFRVNICKIVKGE